MIEKKQISQTLSPILSCIDGAAAHWDFLDPDPLQSKAGYPGRMNFEKETYMIISGGPVASGSLKIKAAAKFMPMLNMDFLAYQQPIQFTLLYWLSFSVKSKNSAQSSNNNFRPGEWYFVSQYFDGNKTQLCINQEPADHKVSIFGLSDPKANVTQNPYLGLMPNLEQPEMVISGLSIFSRLLTTTEVNLLYHAL